MKMKVAILATTALSAFVTVAPTSAQEVAAPAAIDNLARVVAPAQEDAMANDIVVTGSRLIRDGTAAPTPLAVFGSEALEQQASGNIAAALNTSPVFAGSVSSNAGTSTFSPSSGLAGLNSISARGLGINRTLVLVDGQRVVPVLTFSNSAVDINSLPQQLVQRVETVTGGASAVYGSDAVGGVVNFILDRKFTGFKVDLSGSITTYGDDEGVKLDATYGTAFAGGRGHILISGQLFDKAQLTDSSNRKWNRDNAYCNMANPLWTATNGLPRRIIASDCGFTATQGGLINNGPLRGTMFGVGGVPMTFQYGSLVSNPYMSGGGDYALTTIEHVRRGSDLDPLERRKNLFGLLSYELSYAVTATATGSWNRNNARVQSTLFYGNPTTGFAVRNDNAFIPASIRPALGSANFSISSLNGDIPPVEVDSERDTRRFSFALDGRLPLLDGEWLWNAYYQYGDTTSHLRAYATNQVRFARAIDAVSSSSGQIVCRVNADANPANDDPACVPYNLFGIGVNSPAALAYVAGVGALDQRNSQQVMAASISGQPFSLWAGPVSLALSAEHRIEKARGTSNAAALGDQLFSGNYKPVNGDLNVTEAAIELGVPLLKDVSFAKELNLEIAARATDYSTSGYVTTWKVGGSYTPFDGLRFRGNISRDIRAANLGELFLPGSAKINFGNLTDPFTNQIGTWLTSSAGNAALKPEKADSFALGVVAQPAFLRGLSATIDYWQVKVAGQIASLGAAQMVQQCFYGNTDACTLVTRAGSATLPGAAGTPYAGQTFAPVVEVVSRYMNLAASKTRGVDIAVAYRFSVGGVLPEGDIALRWDQTFYLKGYTDPATGVPRNIEPASMRINASATYKTGPWMLGLTGRYAKSDPNPQTIVCQSNCPLLSTLPSNVTTQNYILLAPSVYLDASVTRDFTIGNAEAQVYLNVRNLLNRDPNLAAVPFYPFSLPQSTVGEDALGRIFRLGVRVRM